MVDKSCNYCLLQDARNVARRVRPTLSLHCICRYDDAISSSTYEVFVHRRTLQNTEPARKSSEGPHLTPREVARGRGDWGVYHVEDITALPSDFSTVIFRSEGHTYSTRRNFQLTTRSVIIVRSIVLIEPRWS